MMRGLYGKLFGRSASRASPARETAWLDGLRGVAAFLVMINHYSMGWLSPFSDAPFGAASMTDRNPDGVWWYREGERFWDIWRLPFLRVLMVSGDAQVAIFFVLSGFVLSWGPLALARSNRSEKFAQSIGSSVIRRWFRLFLPCIAVSLIYLLDSLVKNYNGIQSTLAEIWKYIGDTEHWAKPFDVTRQAPAGSLHPYNFVMWTIPFEFSGSIFIYVTLMGIGRVKKYSRRRLAMMFITLYALVSIQWGYWLFGTGLMLADYVQEAGGFNKLSQRTGRKASFLWFAIFTIGVYLMGYTPDMDWYSVPIYYRWLSYIPIPHTYRDFVGEGRFWWGWSGILVVAGSCHFKAIRGFFELALPQYLGKISFMLYLIHIWVNDLVGTRTRAWLYDHLATREFSETFAADVFITTPLLNILVHLILWSLCIPISMGIAHVLEIYIDRPCTNFGKIVDDKLCNGFRDSKQITHEEEQLLRASNRDAHELEQMIPR